MSIALVFGAGGFIGGHLVDSLKEDGLRVIGADIKEPEFASSNADDFILGDLGNPQFMSSLLKGFANSDVVEIYQLAADMGGAGYIFTGLNDANVMTNSVRINLNLLSALVELGYPSGPGLDIFYSSSACIYPEHIQENPDEIDLREEYAYPANPDSEYGWEKLFSERLMGAYRRNFGFRTHVARYHNVYGPRGTFSGGKEKAPAAICRKVASAIDGGKIEIWGDGHQTRSFLYVSDCVEATKALMRSAVFDPLNIGSEEMVTINQLANIAIELSGKRLSVEHVEGPQGVRGRNSNNSRVLSELGWSPNVGLRAGMGQTYEWISSKVEVSKNSI